MVAVQRSDETKCACTGSAASVGRIRLAHLSILLTNKNSFSQQYVVSTSHTHETSVYFYFHFDHDAVSKCKQIYTCDINLFEYTFTCITISRARASKHRHEMNNGTFQRNATLKLKLIRKRMEQHEKCNGQWKWRLSSLWNINSTFLWCWHCHLCSTNGGIEFLYVFLFQMFRYIRRHECSSIFVKIQLKLIEVVLWSLFYNCNSSCFHKILQRNESLVRKNS